MRSHEFLSQPGALPFRTMANRKSMNPVSVMSQIEPRNALLRGLRRTRGAAWRGFEAGPRTQQTRYQPNNFLKTFRKVKQKSGHLKLRQCWLLVSSMGKSGYSDGGRAAHSVQWAPE